MGIFLVSLIWNSISCKNGAVDYRENVSNGKDGSDRELISGEYVGNEVKADEIQKQTKSTELRDLGCANSKECTHTRGHNNEDESTRFPDEFEVKTCFVHF